MRLLAEGYPKYKYLFEAVSNCMRSFQVLGEPNKASIYQTDNVQFEGLLQEEKDLF